MTTAHDKLVALAQKIAEMKTCNEDEGKCTQDSGPFCGTHDQFWCLEGLIAEARAALEPDAADNPART